MKTKNRRINYEAGLLNGRIYGIHVIPGTTRADIFIFVL